MAISLRAYFGKPHSSQHAAAAIELLDRVERLLALARAAGAYADWMDADTDSCISGSSGGDGDGGFRTPGSRTGAPNSSHREARAVDVYDPNDGLDAWITDAALEAAGLYREDPAATPGWCHLTTRAPGSGRRTFTP